MMKIELDALLKYNKRFKEFLQKMKHNCVEFYVISIEIKKNIEFKLQPMGHFKLAIQAPIHYTIPFYWQ